MVELIWEGKRCPDGKKVAPARLALPFQDIETVNESTQQWQMTLDLFGRGQQGEWRNRLIWGDKKYVLPSLLPEFRGFAGSWAFKWGMALHLKLNTTVCLYDAYNSKSRLT